MEKQKDQDLSSSLKESTEFDKSVEKRMDPTSSNIENDSAQESFLSDKQMNMDEFGKDKQKMEIESTEAKVQSEMETQSKDQHSTITTNSKIERRRADAPEYFGNCVIPVFHKVEFSVCLSFGMFYSKCQGFN